MCCPEIGLFVKDRETYTDYRIPAMVVSPKGDIYVAFECREEASDWANIDLCILKSTDAGVSFQEIKKIYGHGKTMNNPVLVQQDDAVLFIYCEEYSRVFYIASRDEGNTWSEPQEITSVFDDLEHTVVATGPGHGVVTPEGTIVLPVWLAYDPKDPHAHRPSYLTTLYSQDGGKTWKHGEKLEAEDLVNANETAIVCLDDGSVLLNIRNRHPEKRARFLAVSPNGYDDWTYLGMDDRFPDPWCMGSMCAGDGKVFFCNCESEEGRKNLTLKSGTDGFQTFDRKPVCDLAGYSEIGYWKNNIFVLYETYLMRDEKRCDHKLYLKKINLIEE